MSRWRSLFISFLLISGCTKVPEIPRLSADTRHPIQRLLIDDQLGPKDVRQILHALNEDGSLNSVVKFFDELPDDSIDGLTTTLNRWLYDDGRFEKILKQRIENHQFSDFASWVKEEAEYPGAPARRDLIFAALRDPRAIDFIRRLPRFIEPRLLEAWRKAKRKSDDDFATIPETKDKPLLAQTAAQDVWSLFTTRGQSDSTRSIVSMLLEKEAVDDLYRGMKDFSDEGKGAPGFEAMRLGLRRMLEKKPEKFQEPANRDNQLDLLLYFAENAGGDSKGLFKALNDGLQTHSELIKKKKTSLQALVIQVYVERLRSEFSRPSDNALYWMELLKAKTETQATLELYQRVLNAWLPVVGPADASTPSGTRLAVHLNAYVTARWLYLTLKDHTADFDTFDQATPFSTQFWAMEFSPKPVTVNFAKSDKGDFSFPEKERMIEGLEPIESLVEKQVESKEEPVDRFSYQLALDKTKTSLASALFDALRRIDRRREIIGADTIFNLAIEYATNPELGGGFIIASFETDRLVDMMNRMLLVSSLDRFRSFLHLLFGDLNASKKGGLLTPDLNQVIVEVFSENPAKQQQVQKLLWSAQSVAELDDRATPDSVTPFQAYRTVVAASHFEKNKPHWVGSALVYLSQIRAAAVSTDPTNANEPLHPLFYDGLQTRGFAKKMYALSLMDPTDWTRLRTALNEFSDPVIASNNLKYFSDSIVPHRDGFVSAAEWWDQTALPHAWESPTTLEWEWLRDAVAHDDHQTVIRFFEGADRAEWARIVGDLKRLHGEGSLARILKLLALIQDDRLRDFSRVLLRADQSGELLRILDLMELAAKPTAKL